MTNEEKSRRLGPRAVKSGLRWEKYKGLKPGYDLWLDGANIARVLKESPGEYRVLPLKLGNKIIECKTLRAGKKAAVQMCLDYVTHAKASLEAFHG